jgi:hypothetical protein
MNCPKCDADISDTFERDDPSCGITAGWYCDACDLGIAEWEAPREPMEGDVPSMTAKEFRGDRPLGTPLSELSGQPGDPRNPDFKVERVEVDYALGMPWSRTGIGVTPNRIRLVRPLARASWKDGKFSLGSLDPLIEEFMAKPPRPDQRAPLVIVEGGRARIDTDYGPVQVLADARIDNSRLMRLNARLPAASLKSGDTEARGLSAVVDLTTTGDRVALKVEAAADRFTVAEAGGTAARLNLTGDLPYPDLKMRRGDGRAVIAARLTADALSAGIRNAGAIFLGGYTPEAIGDYCAGPNHVLPTSRTARFSSPLGVYDFQKRSSIIHVSRSGAQTLGVIAAELAYGEGLSAHARSAELRLK